MQTNRLIGSIFQDYLRDTGLSNSQMSILFVLSKRKKLKQSQLAEILLLEKSTVSRNIIRLLEKEWLRKLEGKYLGITDLGLKKVEEIIPRWEIAMEATNQRLGKEGVEALEKLYHQIKS